MWPKAKQKSLESFSLGSLFSCGTQRGNYLYFNVLLIGSTSQSTNQVDLLQCTTNSTTNRKPGCANRAKRFKKRNLLNTETLLLYKLNMFNVSSNTSNLNQYKIMFIARTNYFYCNRLLESTPVTPALISAWCSFPSLVFLWGRAVTTNQNCLCLLLYKEALLCVSPYLSDVHSYAWMFH